MSFYNLYELDEFNVLKVIQISMDKLVDLQEYDLVLVFIVIMFNDVFIQVEEVVYELCSYCDYFEIDLLCL